MAMVYGMLRPRKGMSVGERQMVRSGGKGGDCRREEYLSLEGWFSARGSRFREGERMLGEVVRSSKIVVKTAAVVAHRKAARVGLGGRQGIDGWEWEKENECDCNGELWGRRLRTGEPRPGEAVAS